MDFIDISLPGYDAAKYNDVTYDMAMEEMHVIDEKNTVHLLVFNVAQLSLFQACLFCCVLHKLAYFYFDLAGPSWSPCLFCHVLCSGAGMVGTFPHLAAYQTVDG